MCVYLLILFFNCTYSITQLNSIHFHFIRCAYYIILRAPHCIFIHCPIHIFPSFGMLSFGKI